MKIKTQIRKKSHPRIIYGIGACCMPDCQTIFEVNRVPLYMAKFLRLVVVYVQKRRKSYSMTFPSILLHSFLANSLIHIGVLFSLKWAIRMCTDGAVPGTEVFHRRVRLKTSIGFRTYSAGIQFLHYMRGQPRHNI